MSISRTKYLQYKKLCRLIEQIQKAVLARAVGRANLPHVEAKAFWDKVEDNLNIIDAFYTDEICEFANSFRCFELALSIALILHSFT